MTQIKVLLRRGDLHFFMPGLGDELEKSHSLTLRTGLEQHKTFIMYKTQTTCSDLRTKLKTIYIAPLNFDTDYIQ